MPGLLLAALALLLFGCGESSSDSTLSKSAFIAQGNKICEKAEEERVKDMEAEGRKLGIQIGEVPPPAKRDKVIVAAIVSYEKAADKLRELAPDGEEEKVEEMVEAMEEAAEKVRSDPGTAATSPIQFKEASAQLDKYGLKKCAL